MNDILADHELVDMIQWLDDVRSIHEQAHKHAVNDADTMRHLQFLIDDALRESADFLFALRRKQLGI
jgi:hypothetical protein